MAEFKLEMIKRIVVIESPTQVSASRFQIHIKSDARAQLSIPAEDLGEEREPIRSIR